MNVEVTGHAHDDPTRRDAVDIWLAAITAANPSAALRRELILDDDILSHPQLPHVNTSQYNKIYVVGAGKAASHMALALEEIMGARLDGGIVITKDDHAAPTRTIETVLASHPLPDRRGVDATKQVIALAKSAGPRDLVLCCFTGGGSSLLTAPAPGLTLEDTRVIHDALLSNNAPIASINTVRKHTSIVKGGKLQQLISPAHSITLLANDVLDGPPDVIASGPTLPDSSSWDDVRQIFEHHDLSSALPFELNNWFQSRFDDNANSTLPPTSPCFRGAAHVQLVSSSVAVEAARRRASELGYEALAHPTPLTNNIHEEALRAFDEFDDLTSRPSDKLRCLIFAGEPTVSLPEHHGTGGRCTHFAALVLQRSLHSPRNWLVAALSTDGTDGPTDVMGAIIDPTTTKRSRHLAASLDEAVTRFDAHAILTRTGALLRSGPTGTNVNDLYVFMERPER